MGCPLGPQRLFLQPLRTRFHTRRDVQCQLFHPPNLACIVPHQITPVLLSPSKVRHRMVHLVRPLRACQLWLRNRCLFNLPVIHAFCLLGHHFRIYRSLVPNIHPVLLFQTLGSSSTKILLDLLRYMWLLQKGRYL
jgi:hypothetical protein